MSKHPKLAKLLLAGREALEFMRAAVQQGVRIKGLDVDQNADVKALKEALQDYGLDVTPRQSYECGTGQEEDADAEWLDAVRGPQT